MAKKIYTRQEFDQLRLDTARKMAQDKKLKATANGVLADADQYYYFHQPNWLGEPVLNLPQDMFAIQEIMFQTRPDYVIECGVAWGGGLLFYATLLQALGGKGVIGIDIFMPDDMKQRVMSSPVAKRRCVPEDGDEGAVGDDMIKLFEASSIEDSTKSLVAEELKGSKKVLVILDSHHTHDHVLRELQLYSEFVGEGQYLICGDTIVEYMGDEAHRDRPWGKGNNPMTALNEFLDGNDQWAIDEDLEAKLLLTSNPRGFIQRVKNAA